MYRDGDVFGEMALLDGGRRSATVMTMTRSRMLTLDRDDMLQRLRERPELALRMIHVLNVRLRHTTDRAGDMALMGVRQRLAAALLDLCERHGVPSEHGVRIRLRLTQSDLASMVGTSRESVNRALSDLRKRGVVSHHGRGVMVVDPEGLRNDRL